MMNKFLGAKPAIDSSKGMSTEEVITKSTSLQSAETQDIMLRETTMTRLLFRPMIVTNPSDPQASVRGTFVFQKKGKNDEWADLDGPALSKLHKGEGTALEIKSEELRKLHKGISALYALYSSHGIVPGVHIYVEANKKLQAVANLSDEELDAIVEADKTIGIDALCRLLRWAGKLADVDLILKDLEKIEVESLQNLSSLVGISLLKQALVVWQGNSQNPDEEFWQKEFTTRSFLLEQLYSFPIVVVKGKAYVGGKSIFNTGGNVVDFLGKNKLTHNAALVEIKTPMTPLLGKKYREGLFNISTELSGSVLQVLDYRKSFIQELAALVADSGVAFDACEPPCRVIIGNTSELDSKDKRKSFELFRRQVIGVDICTYDEVFARTEQLLKVLEPPSCGQQ
jgi:hypothetical protein